MDQDVEQAGNCMSWADRAKEALRRGESVTVRPRGHSMRPKVNDGDLVTLVPCVPADLSIGSIVLVRVGGNDYLHRHGDRWAAVPDWQ